MRCCRSCDSNVPRVHVGWEAGWKPPTPRRAPHSCASHCLTTRAAPPRSTPRKFHTNVGDEPWARYVTPYGVSRVGRDQIQSQLQHASWSQAQVQRRVAGALPAGCQTLCTSPYLDACLFQYDERAISPDGRARAMADQQPIKFVSRRHPDRLKFKLDVSAVMAAAAAGGGDARVPKHLRFVLHPMSPFLLVLLQGYGLPKAVLAVFYM